MAPPNPDDTLSNLVCLLKDLVAKITDSICEEETYEHTPEVDNYVVKEQQKYIKRVYNVWMAVSTMLLVAFTLYLYIFGNSVGKREDVFWSCLVINLAVHFGVFWLNHTNRDTYSLGFPVYSFITIYSLSEITVVEDEYRFNEMTLCVLLQLLIHSLLVVDWKLNSISLIVGSTIYYYRCVCTFGLNNVPFELAISLIMANTMFAFLTCFIKSKMCVVYALIYKNKMILSEILALLENFPECIVIESCDKETGETSCDFVNAEFKNKILCQNGLAHNSEDYDLNKIKVEIEHNEEGKSETEYTTLQKAIERNCSPDFNNTETNLNIQYSDTNENEEVSEIVRQKQHFRVKTMKVNWNLNKNSYMHVFIDNTDVIKLEEAKNDIRCQKIMFTSSSHEFRTPLNAILNSMQLLEL